MFSHLTTPNIGVFNQVSIFCGKHRRKHKGEQLSLVRCETKELEQNIYKYAVMLNDVNMKRKLEIDEGEGTLNKFRCERGSLPFHV